MKKLLLTILTLLIWLSPFMANAAKDSICWNYATERADGTKLPVSEIASHNVYVNKVAVNVPMPAKCLLISALKLTAGSHNAAVTSVDTKANESVYSKAVVVVIAGTIPTVNTPAVITGKATGQVTEDLDGNNDNLLGAVGKLKIVDPDKGEALFIAEKVTTKYGVLTIKADGNWFYGADKFNAEINALNKGQSLTDKVIVKSVDGTTKTITIKILGVTDVLSFPKAPDVFLK